MMILHTALIATALALLAPSDARADGWWEVACNGDGHEGSGGCSNPENMNSCGTCDASNASRSASQRALSIGSGLALLGFVGYRIGRKRRNQ